jgi:hypothetical protein
MVRSTLLRTFVLPAIELGTASRFWTQFRQAAKRDFAPPRNGSRSANDGSPTF